MGYSPDHSRRIRARILDCARRLFKEEGVEAVTVDKVMAEAGLTRGGFYAHFKSKDELFAEALAETPVFDLFRRHDGADWTRRVIEEYLGPLHRDRPGKGCPLAAHASSIARASPPARHNFTATVRSLADELARRLGSDEAALTCLVLMVGGVVLARAVDDPELSAALLDACRRRAIVS